MTTIRLVDPSTVTGKTKEIFDAVLKREEKVFGATTVSNIWRCMGHSADYLEANWHRSRALMQRGRSTPLQRELIATAVSVANHCRYWIDSHVAAVMRLGVDEVGVTELMGVAEHAQCLGVVAAGLLLDAGATSCLVQPVDPTGAPEPVREVLEEIRRWGSEAIGTDEIPTIWRAIARNPHYIQSTWRKEQVVMRSDRLSARDKRRVALAIAMNGKSRYMIEYHVAILRRLGDTDEDLLEVLGVVDHYNCLNTLSDGMQIVSDIRPPA